MNKKIKYSIMGLVSLIVVGALIIPLIKTGQSKKNSENSYQTEPAKLGDITVNISGVGSLRSNQSAILTWQTTGRIEEISVDINETVKVGETLASLEETTLPQNVISAFSDLVTAKRELENLINTNSTKAQAQFDLVTAQNNYNKALWAGKQSTIPNITDQNKIDIARANVTINIDKVAQAQKNYNDFAEAPDSDPTKAEYLLALANAKIALSSAKHTYDFYINTPSGQDVSLSDSKIDLAKAKLDDAQRAWDRVKEGSNPDDIAAAKAKVSSIMATINLSKISAPFAGTITDSSTMVGDLVNTGTVAFRIDDLSKMMVDVKISEVDIKNIQVGQPVTLVFDALPSVKYEGKVSKVTRVGITQSGSVNFTVTILLMKPDNQIMPGMTAAANISTTQLDNVLLIPSRAVRTIDGRRVVFVFQNNKPVMTEITLGASSNSYSQITNDTIKPGDLIILNPSTELTDTQGSYLGG